MSETASSGRATYERYRSPFFYNMQLVSQIHPDNSEDNNSLFSELKNLNAFKTGGNNKNAKPTILLHGTLQLSTRSTLVLNWSKSITRFHHIRQLSTNPRALINSTQLTITSTIKLLTSPLQIAQASSTTSTASRLTTSHSTRSFINCYKHP